jgi:beta-N-acetylhexosaminidase
MAEATSGVKTNEPALCGTAAPGLYPGYMLELHCIMTRAFITGVAATSISPGERTFLREASPWGLILFKRNIENPQQVSNLINDFRECVGRENAPVLVDQEGGRVQRLGPPHWPAYPPGGVFGEIYDRDAAVGIAAAKLGARLIAADLQALGITVDCLPLADLRLPDADLVIGNRAYGAKPDNVAAIAGAVAEGLMDGGVLPVLKHIPGHGRAMADSHKSLPVVNAERAELEATDFAAFRQLHRLPLGMTAHVVYTALDTLPATTSTIMINEVIRGFIGFQGLLMSDDVSMGALSGTIGERSAACLAAGCDVVLHCNGNIEEMEEVAENNSELTGASAQRAAAALAARRRPSEIDLSTARVEFARILRETGATGSAMV